ncbi:uncharacterized protein LOC117654457 [Thrips palmi]|uniref:Uncharacterized protein LOC117654457 n=1 Tax=Thrips palmi TaxID=161013 RepID=A0A6P9AHX9_THRPL|nr:uncharacterized protein LOC117654457 [Thrips palmi]XP_034256989.1 uncharacterized protein LOC117654457 [Thrips palmi]
MGVKKLKRKASEDVPDVSVSKETAISSISEPPKKKHKGLSTEEFIAALKGSDGPEAVREWLYMISSEWEKSLMDRTLNRLKPERQAQREYNKLQSTEKNDSEEKSDEVDNLTPTEKDEEKDEEKGFEKEKNETEDLVTNECAEHIDCFLTSGGSVKDIIGTLPSPEFFEKVSQIQYIFRTLFKVLVRISASHRDKVPEAVEACRELLDSYLQVINNILKRQREPHFCLDLLTAMVALDTKFAKEILQKVTLDEEVVVNLTSLRAPLRSRVAYLKLLVALLIDADSSLLLAVSQMPWILTCVMEGLLYDPSNIVVMYLMTIKKAIVEKSSVFKTSKVNIFNPNTIISLLHLYKWKGPQNRPKTKSLAPWAMKNIKEKPKMENEIDSEEAGLVSSAVHELLLVLLTSHRYGIIFGGTQQTDRNNRLVSNVLKRVGHPWGNPKVADLISKTLAACPDSLDDTMNSIRPFIQPRSSPQWFLCAKFLCQVLEDQHPEEVLLRQLPMSAMKLSTAAINMCIPIPVVRALNAREAEVSCKENIDVAKSSLQLLLSMLRKATAFCDVVRKWSSEKILHYAQSAAFLNLFTKCILENVPSLDSLQKAWQVWSSKLSESDSMEIDGEATTRPVDVLSLLLEVLEMYQRLCPKILNPLHSAQSDFKTSLTNVVLQDHSSEDIALLRNRFFQLLLSIQDVNFVVENNELRNVITIVFQDLISPNPIVGSMASLVLQRLIKRSRSLEGSSHEAIIWLSNFQETASGKKECSEAVNILVESMIRACVSCPKYLDIIACAEDEAGKMMYKHCPSTLALSDGRTLQELFDDLSENKDALPCDDMAHSAKLSPWLPAFLEVLRENINGKKLKRHQKQVVQDFCCKVVLRLLCRFPHSGAFLHLVLHTYPNVIPSKLANYLQSWLPGGSPQPVELNVLGENSAEVKLSTFLFCENDDSSLQDTINKMFISLALPTMHDNPKENLSEAERLKGSYAVIQVVHFICFHLMQLTQLEKLTEGCVLRSQEILLFILDTATHFDQFGKKRNAGLFIDCFKVILFHPFLYQQFNPLVKGRTKSSALLTNLMMKVLKKASTCSELGPNILPFKRKFLEGLKLTTHEKDPKENITNMVDSFQLTFQDISDTLVLISDLSCSTFIVGTKENQKLSQWVQLAEHLLTRASELRTKGSPNVSEVMILPPSVVLQISNWIVYFLPNESIDVTSLLEAFMLYIKSCPQQTCHLSDQLFPCILTTFRCNAAVNNLLRWMASCMPVKDLTASLTATVNSYKTKGLEDHMHVILPLLRAVLKDNLESIKMPVCGIVYSHLRRRIEDYAVKVDRHPVWLPMNTDVVVLLMKRHMKQAEREKVCLALKERAPALTKERLYYLQLITEVLQIHQPQLLLLLLAWLGVALKKYGSASEQAVLAKPLCEAISKFLQEETQEDFKSVVESKVWQETLRIVLKFALVAKDEEQSDLACVLLQTLSTVFQKMYSPQEGHEHVPMVHSMIIQHSEYIRLMLSHNPCKFDLIQFLYILLERNPKIMESSHAPVLLSAYNASVSKTDRALLKILMMYEQCGVDLSQYRPFYWGRQGADYYAIWSQAKVNRSLDKQLRPDQLLNHLKESMVNETIANFPLHSTFKITDAETKFVGTVQVYDPSFYLPLFIYLLSPESLVVCHTFMTSGGLGITLAALSSYDDDVRAAAYTVLARYRSQLEMARGIGKEIALQFLSVMHEGIVALDGENTRLPSIITVFLAKATLHIADPFSPLNKPLVKFILAKPVLNMRTIPEFLELMHSSHVDHLAHRHWILEVVKDGIKSASDVDICMEMFVFKMLLSFYSSCLCDTKSKLFILSCIQSAISVQYGACRLVRDYSLSSWLHQSILSTKVEDSTLIDTMVRLVSKLWESLSLPSKGNPGIPHPANPAGTVFRLLLALKDKLKASVSTETLCHYVSLLSNVVPHLSAENFSVFTKDLLLSTLETISPLCPNKRQFFDLLELGCHFTDIDDTNIANSSLDNCLRTLTIQWIKHRKS